MSVVLTCDFDWSNNHATVTHRKAHTRVALRGPHKPVRTPTPQDHMHKHVGIWPDIPVRIPTPQDHMRVGRWPDIPVRIPMSPQSWCSLQ